MQLRLLAGNKNGTLKQGNEVEKMSKGQEVKGCKGSITQVCVCVGLRATVRCINLTLADVSNQPRKPVSLQKLSIRAELFALSFFWSHLLASSTDGMGLPLASFTLLSRSCFHLETASNVEPLVTSNTTKAPTASL